MGEWGVKNWFFRVFAGVLVGWVLFFDVGDGFGWVGLVCT